MRRLYWIALNNHYILWVAFFGLGLFTGKSFSSYYQVSSFVYLVMTGSILLVSLVGPIYILRRNTLPDGDIPEAKILLTLVLIPVLMMTVMGYLTAVNSAESPGTGLPTMLEKDGGSISGVVTATGRVSSHPAIRYGSLYFEMSIKSFEYAVSSDKTAGDYIDGTGIPGSDKYSPGDKYSPSDNLGTVNEDKAEATGSILVGEQVCMVGSGRKINIIIRRPGDLIIKRDDFIEVKGEAGTSAGGPSIRASSSNIRITRPDSFSGKIFEFRKTVYNCISRTFYRYLSYRYAPIAEALILGNRTHVPGRLQDDFKQSGTAHLMAISGMHISFLVLILYIILGRSRSGLILAVFIITALVAYNFLLGVKASVLRASIWMVAAIIAGQWNRESNRPRILCISFILLLILDPSFLEDAGFWFSFAAMSGIVFVQPLLMEVSGTVPAIKRIVNNYLCRTLILTISIQITCGPLLLYYFRYLPLVSPVSNICILPFFYALLLLLMISAFFAIIWPPLGGFVLKATPPLFKIITGLAGFFSKPGLPMLKASNMVPAQLLVYYLALFLLLLLARRSLEKKFKGQKI